MTSYLVSGLSDSSHRLASVCDYLLNHHFIESEIYYDLSLLPIRTVAAADFLAFTLSQYVHG